MHEPVKHFSESGFIKDDKDFIKTRDQLESIILESMREVGYLPVHNMGTHWSTEWLGDKYSFKLTVYGSYAGKKKAQEYMCWSYGRLLKYG